MVFISKHDPEARRIASLSGKVSTKSPTRARGQELFCVTRLAEVLAMLYGDSKPQKRKILK